MSSDVSKFSEDSELKQILQFKEVVFRNITGKEPIKNKDGSNEMMALGIKSIILVLSLHRFVF